MSRLVIVAAVAAIAGVMVSASGRVAAAGAEPEGVLKRCAGGFIHVVVRGKHVCRPAPDLRVSIVSTPQANRVGGTFTYVVTVANAGRRTAMRAVLTAAAAAEHVSTSSTRGACSSPSGPLRATCALGRLAPNTRATITIAVRATTLGTLRLSGRASSPTPDARPSDNSRVDTRRVTEPDSVRGYGVRPLSGPGVRPPVAVEVDAISGPSGEDPSGAFWTKYPVTSPTAGEVRGRVVCLTVQGNRATIGGIVEESNDPQNPVGSRVLFGFTDNGEPGVGRDSELSYFNQETESCPVPIQEFPEPVLIEGNYVVRDVQP